MDNVTEQDKQDLLKSYKECEPFMVDNYKNIVKNHKAQFLNIPFVSNFGFSVAVFSRKENKVTKLCGAKLINPECLEWENIDVDPIYEEFVVML